MIADFDHIANNYDKDFTYSEIGKKQRLSVYAYLNKVCDTSLNILELNCGTGEDAIWLAKKGHTIVATDISKKMIEVAEKKASNIESLQFQQLDTNSITSLGSEKFDIIFSNFGGLNCLSKTELNLFFENASKTLTKKGKLVLVIMPKNCVWEILYFILKLKFKTAFRRNTNQVIEVNIDQKKVNTWYYNPKDIEMLSNTHFNVIKKKPIGFFIPPSYLENYFIKRKKFLYFLAKLEKFIGKFGSLSRFSDHFLIELSIKNK